MRTAVPIFFLTLALAGSAAADGLPHVSEAMHRAGFWAAQHPSPDKIVMTHGQIERFNAALAAEDLTEDIAAIPPALSADKIVVDTVKLLAEVERQKLFHADGKKVTAGFYASMKQDMALEHLSADVPVRYAVTTAFAHQRFIPTDEPLYSKPGNIHFDEVQNSGMDPATCVLVVHQTVDGEWFLVKDGIAAGWVRKEVLAFTDRQSWMGMLQPEDFVVVTAPRSHVFRDEGLSLSAGVVRMGVRLALKEMMPDKARVLFPQRLSDGSLRQAQAYVPSGNVVRGYLPYTPRVVLEQAFKLLGAPYGWGDMRGDQDCSRFVNMVFAVMGFRLPRNSSEQGRSGITLGDFKPEDAPALKRACIMGRGVGGATLLRIKGHIMLYVGEVEKRPFVIHAASGYYQKVLQQEYFVPLRRVVLSDLSLGEGTSRGSLLERVLSVRLVADKLF